MDHGIESAEERVKAGKTRAGRLTLHYTLKPNHLLIEFSDDGSGFNLDQMKKIGIASGVSEEKIKSPQDIANLVFLSGFSTTQSVSEISGRGVGMDAVKQILKKSGCDIVVRVGARPSPGSNMVNAKFIISLGQGFYRAA